MVSIKAFFLAVLTVLLLGCVEGKVDVDTGVDISTSTTFYSEWASGIEILSAWLERDGTLNVAIMNSGEDMESSGIEIRTSEGSKGTADRLGCGTVLKSREPCFIAVKHSCTSSIDVAVYLNGKNQVSETVSCGPSGDGKQQGSSFEASDLPTCSGNELFSVSPVSLQQVTGIVPLGNLNPKGGHVFQTDHVYFYVHNPDGGQTPPQITVVSPGDVWIKSMASAEYLSASPPYTDYSIYFYPCEELRAYFFHVSSISGKLRDAFGTGGRCSEYETGVFKVRRCEKEMDVKVSAGEVIGTAGGRPNQYALDMGASDSRTPSLPYVNPSRWYEVPLHVACPLDYFRQDVKDKIWAKLGGYGS